MNTNEKLSDVIFCIVNRRFCDPKDREAAQKIWDAYELAFQAHSAQTRKSGEPYIIHPVEVARIVAEDMELDPNCVIAALLHDVVEDTDYTLEDIRKMFGDDVAHLVDTVTKKIPDGGRSKQVENFKQILRSVHYDIRALMIKLADRLHNMRTLSSMRADKQVKIASETEFFYAPLAGRLGLYRIKSELENLSFNYKCAEEYASLEKALDEDRQKTAVEVNNFVQQIEKVLSNKGLKARVEVRYRKPYSIWRNMHEENTDFAGVEFKHYIRVIYTPSEGYSEKDTALAIYSALSDAFQERPGSFVNYINRPKENGYESLHVKLLGGLGRWEELHISSERMLRNSCIGFLAKSTEESKVQWLEKLKAMLEDIAEGGTEAFIKGVSSSLYNEDCYVLTPKGKVVILPKGASAIDFAYALHSDIGNHAQYAIINGKIASIKTTLQRGDCVQIVCSDDVHPQLDWKTYVKTYKAEKFIGRYWAANAAESILPYSICPCCHPLPGDEVVGFKDADGHITLHKRSCSEATHLASEKGDSIVTVDDFHETPAMLYPASVNILAIDRAGLLRDIIDTISGNGLSMSSISSTTQDWIVTCKIDFGVHSHKEFDTVLHSISSIPGVKDAVSTL